MICSDELIGQGEEEARPALRVQGGRSSTSPSSGSTTRARTTGRRTGSGASTAWTTAGGGRRREVQGGRDVTPRPVRIGCSGWNYADWRGRVYPPGCPPRRWLALLRDAVRHRRGELDVLPARQARSGRALGGGDAAGLPLHGQGEPLPHAHEAADRHGARGGAAVRRHRAARRVAEARDRSCGSCRSGSTATTTGSRSRSSGYPPGRHCFEFRHPSWFTSEVYGLLHTFGVALRDRRRRPPPAAGPAAHDRLDADPLPLRRAGAARQLLRDRAAGVGGADRASCAREAGVFAYFNNDWEAFAVRNGLRLSASWRLEAWRRGARLFCPSAAGWSSQVARRAHNPKVAGSNPAPAIRKPPLARRLSCLTGVPRRSRGRIGPPTRNRVDSALSRDTAICSYVVYWSSVRPAVGSHGPWKGLPCPLAPP